MCEDSLYNGYWAGNVTALAGWSACSASSSNATASSVAECSSTSARHQRVEACPPRQVITPQMLDDALAAQGAELHNGDILLVRTGHLVALVDASRRTSRR